MNEEELNDIIEIFTGILLTIILLFIPFIIVNALKLRKEEVLPPQEGIWYEITIDNTSNSNNLSDYQVLLEINGDEQFFNDFNNDQKTIEAYDEDKSTSISFYVEEWDTINHNAKIWLKIPLIPANSTKKVYLKSNPNRTISLSNPYSVFIRFDDFEDYDIGDTPDPNKGWEIVDGDPQIVNDGTGNKVLEIENFSTHDSVALNLPAYYPSLILEYKWQVDRLQLRNGYLSLKEDEEHITTSLLENGEEKWYNGSAYRSFTPTLNYQADIYHEDKVIFTGNDYLVERDGILHDGGLRNSIVNGVNKINWETYAAGTYTHRRYLDNIRVRKHTDPEPTVTYNKL